MLGTKMRGIADPYTLGIIIAIVGAAMANMLHGDDASSSSVDVNTHEISRQIVVQADETDRFIDE